MLPHSAPPLRVVRFGAFQLDLRTGELLGDGHSQTLPDQPFKILALLLQHAGEVVMRDELRRQLWSADTFVDFEHGLNAAIKRLRLALGDSADDPRYIETVPRRGYRLIAPVIGGAEAPGSDAASVPESVATAPIATDPHVVAAQAPATLAAGLTRRGRVPLSLALVALVTLACAAWLWRSRASSSNVAPDTVGWMATNPLTAYPGWEGSPTLSPDGTQVAFEWTGTRGDPDIYVKLVDDGEPVRLTTDPRWELGPAWSPDGRRVAFLSEPLGTGAAGVHPDYRDLMVVPALGGTVRHIMPLTVFTAPLEHRGMNWMAWTPDSKWLAVGALIDGNAGLWLVEVDGPGRRRVTEPPPGHVDHSPRVSADGRRVAFARSGPTSAGVLLVLPLGPALSPDGPAREIVDPTPGYVGAVAWGADQSSLMYSVGSNGAMSRLQLVRLGPDRMSSAGAPAPLPFGDQATGLDVAPSGRVVYVRRQRDTGFWSLDLESPAEGVTALRQFESSFDERTPHYSPDARQLAFVSTRSGTEEIWIARVDGANPRQMTTMGGVVCSDPQWSPDGRQIAFSSTKGGPLDIYLLDPATATIRRLTSTAGEEARPRWSRDGRWIYFSADAEGQARPGIWKISPAGGGALQVTTDGGITAEESHDGRVLYVTRPHQPALQLWRVPLDGGPESLIAEDVAVAQNVVVGRRAVYYLAVGPQVQYEPPPAGMLSLGPSPGVMAYSVAAIDFATGRRTTLASAGDAWIGVTLSPDERRLITTVRNSETLDLMLVDPTPTIAPP